MQLKESLRGFIDDLKVLLDLNADAKFRLTQSTDPETRMKKQFIEIEGTNSAVQGSLFKSLLEVECVFKNDQYPDQLEPKEIGFFIDSVTC